MSACVVYGGGDVTGVVCVAGVAAPWGGVADYCCLL